MNTINKLACKNCGNDENFIAKYLYSFIVDSQGNKLDKEEMDDEPEYQCQKSGSCDVHFEDQ